jgi:hypothetical protein
VNPELHAEDDGGVLNADEVAPGISMRVSATDIDEGKDSSHSSK